MTSTTQCLHCQIVFNPKPRQKYCSQSCVSKAYYIRKRRVQLGCTPHEEHWVKKRKATIGDKGK